MNMSLIVMEGKYGALDTDHYSHHGYYIIKFYLYQYTIQEEFSIDVQVISSWEILFEGTYFFPINNKSHYYVLQKTNPYNNFFT